MSAPVDDETRCAICAGPRVEDARLGCVRGRCSQRPLPDLFYAPVRAAFEYGRSVQLRARSHRFLEPTGVIWPVRTPWPADPEREA